MITDLAKDKTNYIDSQHSKNSIPYMRLIRLMVELYNATPDSERPVRDMLPEGAEEQLHACLQYVSESSISSFWNLMQGMSFTLAPSPDLHSIMNEKVP